MSQFFASLLMIYTKRQNRNKKSLFIALYWLAITTNYTYTYIFT